MEATLESQRRLRELIPSAEETGVLKVILLRMRHEEVLSIFDDDDDVVLASLQHLYREATESALNRLMSRLESGVHRVVSCCSGGSTRLEVPPPPPAVAEPREHVRTWKEWFLQMYDTMLTVGKRICATGSSAFEAVKRAVGSAVNSFMELLQRTMESMSSFLDSIYLILERLVRAIFAIFPAYNTHAHHS